MKQVDNEEYIHTKLTRGKSDNETVKILDKYYGFDEAIQDLEKFIDRHILYDKDEWDSIIEASKRERNFYEKLHRRT